MTLDSVHLNAAVTVHRHRHSLRLPMQIQTFPFFLRVKRTIAEHGFVVLNAAFKSYKSNARLFYFMFKNNL